MRRSAALIGRDSKTVQQQFIKGNNLRGLEETKKNRKS